MLIKSIKDNDMTSPQIIEELVKKRLGLNQNIDIDQIKSGNVKKTYHDNGKSYHMACVYSHNSSSSMYILSYGMNEYLCNKDCGSIHAESSVINNLKPLQKKSRNKKHVKNIDLLVIKTTKTGKLGMSKPCIKCIIDMLSLPPKKGYNIKNVLFSTHDGNIKSTTLKDLVDGEQHVSKYYLQNYKSW
jgi:hypothetical protein